MATKRPPHMLVVCDFCGSAGIIRDAENPTIGVVCAGCGGCGHRKLDLKPFDGRRKVDGIQKVRWSGGGLVPFSSKTRKVKTISYAEFLKGKLP